ncbi:MAG: glycosyltransferase family 2 protein [Defluviimonas sp.]|nr:glycosyltransferase family 2 protein [Defluviimonas sp.]
MIPIPKLDQLTQARDGAFPVVVLIHNERNIVGEFLRHYRGICSPHFLIADDHSSDGTREFLAAQPDVSLFSPIEGSGYRADKALWRKALLDGHATGRWALSLDADEFLVFSGMESRSLEDYCAALDREGAEAVMGPMVDMYADKPLARHVYPEDAGQGLLETFPYFDRQPGAFWLRLRNPRQRKRYPTPPLALWGGMRVRLFQPGPPRHPFSDRVVRRLSHLDQPLNIGPLGLLRHRIALPFIGKKSGGQLDMTKIPLLRWDKSIRFSGGSHALSVPRRLSESMVALLHFKFTRGIGGIEYIARRGTHNAGAEAYHRMLAMQEVMDSSPMWSGSVRYRDSSSLAGIVRDIPAR